MTVPEEDPRKENWKTFIEDKQEVSGQSYEELRRRSYILLQFVFPQFTSPKAEAMGSNPVEVPEFFSG